MGGSGHAARRQQGSGTREESFACLFAFYIVGRLAGTRRLGGRSVTGLSVGCHTLLWQHGIDEEQQQDDEGLPGNRNRKRRRWEEEDEEEEENFNWR